LKKQRWHSCNILRVDADARHVWAFAAGKKGFTLGQEQSVPAALPLPARLVGKDWTILVQPKLNVALLPIEKVFLRVIQLPISPFEETVAMVRQSGGECAAFEADVTKETMLAAMAEAARRRWGRIDVLHYNVGVSIAGGDAPLAEISETAVDRIMTINLRGAIMACKHVLPVMRAQRSGVIIMISSVAAWEQYPNVAYKASKAAMIAFTQQIAIQNAEFGIRANVILPGLMDTPMAVDTRARASGKSRADVAASRDARVPLRHKMGTAWDVANAALFLASDEANFITGVALPVDGGALVHIN